MIEFTQQHNTRFPHLSFVTWNCLSGDSRMKAEGKKTLEAVVNTEFKHNKVYIIGLCTQWNKALTYQH